jgi:hypothetical protein
MVWLKYIWSWIDFILGGVVITTVLAMVVRQYWGVAHWDEERLKKQIRDVARTPDS